MDRIDVDGIGIEYRWIGPRSGPVVVFLHEGLGCVTTWRDFPDRVADASGLGVVVYSRWGYGGSDPRPLPWPVDHMEGEATTRLPVLLDALDVGERILWGHSDGGTVALVYAGTQDDPLLRGVISVAAHVFAGEPIGMASIEAIRGEHATGELDERLARHHADPDGAFHGWADTWAHLDTSGWSVESHLAGVAVPTLVVQGSADEYGTLRQVDAICAGIGSGATRRVLDGCGHRPHVDAPDEMLAETLAFLGDIDAAG